MILIKYVKENNFNVLCCYKWMYINEGYYIILLQFFFFEKRCKLCEEKP
jgi:hypothetical protein